MFSRGYKMVQLAKRKSEEELPNCKRRLFTDPNKTEASSSSFEIPDCFVSQQKVSSWLEDCKSYVQQQAVPVTCCSGPGPSPKVYRNLDEKSLDYFSPEKENVDPEQIAEDQDIFNSDHIDVDTEPIVFDFDCKIDSQAEVQRNNVTLSKNGSLLEGQPALISVADTPVAVEQMGISEDNMVPAKPSKSDRKHLRQMGQSYHSPDGTNHPAKEFKHFSCKCVFRCDTHFSEEARREIFSRFWKLGSWDAQTAFLYSAVSEVPVKRHNHTPLNLQRSKTLHYTVNGHRVCKAVFCSTLGISPKRVTYVINNKVKAGIVSPDKRGKHEPANKISPEVQEKVATFFNKFPKYKSHYSDSPKLYFSPDLTYRKIHSLYTEENPDHPVSLFVFMRELKKYNVGIYLPKKDTCARCDEYKMKNKANLTVEERITIEKSHKEHIARAEIARKELKETEEECRQPNSLLLCFTFDLEKTQPIPYLNTSVAFYKRQMWLYNLGVNTRHNKKGHMFVWQEIEGKRGSCEIASSLLTFLQEINLNNYDNIHTFSDCCGGQNRNKNIVAFFMFICLTTHIKSWTHTFLESGHSYLPNDTDFGKIESIKKRNVGIYTLSDWTTIMQMCKFSVTHMKDKFVDVAKLQSYFTFRTVDTQGNKFSWLKLKWLKVSKENECLMQYKYSSDNHEELRTIDFSKRNKLCELKNVVLEPLYKEPIKLSFEKFKDLQDLTAYVPSHLASFFTNLPHEVRSRKISNPECIPDEETE